VLELKHVLPQEVVGYYIGQEQQVQMYVIVEIAFLRHIVVQQDTYYLDPLVYLIL
jgi:hypothetical protein